jgi:chaperonin cofactor prefoldin
MLMKVLPGSQLPLEVEAVMQELYDIEKQIQLQQAWIDELENSDDIKEFKKKIDDTLIELTKKRIELKIDDENKTILSCIAKRNELLEKVSSMIPDNSWGKNAMSRGKKDEVSSTDGKLRIIRSTRTERVIIPTIVREKFPFVIENMINENLIKIPLKYAEIKLSKEQINECAEKTVKHTYETQIRDGSGGKLIHESDGR